MGLGPAGPWSHVSPSGYVMEKRELGRGKRDGIMQEQPDEEKALVPIEASLKVEPALSGGEPGAPADSYNRLLFSSCVGLQ